MNKLIFLFDLDATLTKREIMPEISREFGVYEQLRKLTENTKKGVIPFKQNFLQRVELLREIPVSAVHKMIEDIELNELLADFVQKNQERCYIVTASLDIWIEGLMKKINMENHVFSSKALVKDDYIQDVVSILDKNAVISQMIMPFAAVGDGNNDAEMIEGAEIGIGYGGVKEIAPSVLACADYAFYDEKKLAEFLTRLL